MIKREAKFQTLFNHWLKAEYLPTHRGGFAFELKDTRGKDYLPFSAVKEHQLNALLAANGKGIIYKISDESRGHKPFDCFALSECFSFIVIKYPDLFVMIPVKIFIIEGRGSKKRSLTKERACEIAWEKVPLNGLKARKKGV